MCIFYSFTDRVLHIVNSFYLKVFFLWKERSVSLRRNWFLTFCGTIWIHCVLNEKWVINHLSCRWWSLQISQMMFMISFAINYSKITNSVSYHDIPTTLLTSHIVWFHLSLNHATCDGVWCSVDLFVWWQITFVYNLGVRSLFFLSMLVTISRLYIKIHTEMAKNCFFFLMRRWVIHVFYFCPKFEIWMFMWNPPTRFRQNLFSLNTHSSWYKDTIGVKKERKSRVIWCVSVTGNLGSYNN